MYLCVFASVYVYVYVLVYVNVSMCVCVELAARIYYHFGFANNRKGTSMSVYLYTIRVFFVNYFLSTTV